MQPIIERYRRTRLRVQEKRNQWKDYFYKAGDLTAFMLRFFREVFRPPYEWRETLYQCYLVGYKSTFLISLTAFIMGAVLTIQTRPSMAAFGAISMIPGMVAVSVVREIGPVITAIICCGKVGSRIGAELGSMRVTEQIDAMEVSAINPFHYLVVTRTIATILMIPLLTIFADMVGFLGAFLAMNIHDSSTMRHFFQSAMARLEFIDVFPAVIKTFFFGYVIGIIGCFKGFRARRGTESVGLAANSAVVASSLAVFIIDMLAAQITDLL
ncbi:MAG TPA: ABC transporter permease [Puia sp.]|jgi:phospholipid/cholesterol/gamma-HCH transport system permease protein|nr:ABC transporter permease [Puia sp.]